MNFINIRLLTIASLVLALSGCGVLQCKLCAKKFGEQEMVQAGMVKHVEASHVRFEPVTITVTGYGAPDAQTGSRAQRELMAIRASEVDAYRTLAERVYGLHVSSSTKVVDFVTSHDHLRAVVDSYLGSAKISSQGLTKEGYYETTLSLLLDEDFFQRFNVSSRSSWLRAAENSTIYHRPPNDLFGTLSADGSHYGLDPVNANGL